MSISSHVAAEPRLWYSFDMKREKTERRIAVITANAFKSGRDRRSGVLRYAADKPNWQLDLYDLVYARTTNAREIVDSIIRTKPDAVICCCSPCVTPLSKRRTELPAHTAILLIDARTEKDTDSFPMLCLDDDLFGKTSAQFFLRRGYRSLSYVGLSCTNERYNNALRRNAFLQTARNSEAQLSDYAFTDDRDRSSPNIVTLSEWLSSLQKPCGIMAYNDSVARQVLDAAHYAKLTVPSQIAIMGVDDEREICESTRPSLSSLLPDFEFSGYKAAKLIDTSLSRGSRLPPFTRIGLHSFIERASTCDLSGSGRIVTLAAEQIRKNAFGNICVRRIAQSLNVSLRLLEKRYREVKGISMYDDILTRRLNHACELLKTTRLPLSDVTARCGVRRTASFSALFKKRFGQTMSAWRESSRKKR